MSTYFWGLLALIALAVTILLLVIGTVYTRRLEAEPKLPFSEEIGAAPRVIKKLRKRETMTPEEFEYVQRIVAIRGNPMALAIPLTLFAMSVDDVSACLGIPAGSHPVRAAFHWRDPDDHLIEPRHSTSARQATQRSLANRGSGGLIPHRPRCRPRPHLIPFRTL